MILTGADGQLKLGTRSIAKVRNWSLSIQRNAIDVTCLEEFDRSYVPGVRNTTGNATIYYDPNQSDDVELLNSILQNRDCSSGPCTEDITFVLNRCGGQGQFRCDCLITEVGPSVSVGEAQSVSVSFQVTGPLDGVF